MQSAGSTQALVHSLISAVKKAQEDSPFAADASTSLSVRMGGNTTTHIMYSAYNKVLYLYLYSNKKTPLKREIFKTCLSSLRRGHADLLCIVPIYTEEETIAMASSCCS